jgi:hypothetical protein
MMARFPRIDSPCPLKLSGLPSAGKDFCRRCERKVHNLSAMSAGERERFMSGCETSACVAYAIRRPAAAWTLAAAAMIVASPALAQDTTSSTESLQTITIVGGVSDPTQAQWEEFDDIDLPELPLIVETSESSDLPLFTAEPKGKD